MLTSTGNRSRNGLSSARTNELISILWEYGHESSKMETAREEYFNMFLCKEDFQIRT